MSPTALVLLAAPNSMPGITQALETALRSVCRPVIAVLGSEFRLPLPDLPVEFVHCPAPTKSIGGLIQAGVTAAESHEVEGLVLALAEQPSLTVEFLNRLVMTHEATRLPIVATQYPEIVGLPAYFAREFFPQLANLKPGQDYRDVIVSNAAKTIRLTPRF